MADRFTIRLIIAGLSLSIGTVALATDPPAKPASSHDGTSRTENSATPAAIQAPPSTSKRQPPIVVAVETTHILEPLRSGGYPDYFAALNERNCHGATALTNGAVLLWQAIGPQTVSAGVLDEYAALLGAKPLSAQGDYFVTIEEMVERWSKGAPPPTPEGQHDDDNLQSEFVLCSDAPWSAEEHPMVAHWLALNEAPLRLITQAGQRPQFYEPIVAPNRNMPALTNAELPLAQSVNNFKLALEARAMLSLKSGKVDAAWSDLMDCHRLLRRMAGMPLIRYRLEVLSAENDLCETELKLLHSGHVSAAQIERMRSDWTSLPSVLPSVDAIDFDERYRFLNAVCLINQYGKSALQQLFGDNFAVSGESGLQRVAADHTFDWNDVLRMGNQWYDREVLISRMADRHERNQALEKALGDLNRMVEDSSGSGVIASWFARKSAHTAASRRAVGELLQQLDSDLHEFATLLELEDQRTIHLNFVQIGFALAAYRAEHGEYPEKLELLTPQYIAKLPQDLYGDRGPLRYHRHLSGYTLHSVGPNGLDELGASADRYGDIDDISVSVTDADPITTFEGSDPLR